MNRLQGRGSSRPLRGDVGLARGVTADSRECHPVGQFVAITRSFLAGGLLIRPSSPRRDVGRAWRNGGYRGVGSVVGFVQIRAERVR